MNHYKRFTLKTGKACLVTLTDRKSRYLLCKKISKKNSTEVKNAMVELLKEQPLKSITPDRGKEFSKHTEISNELNLVEFYFPKTKDIDRTDEYIELKVKEINLTIQAVKKEGGKNANK